MSKRLKKRIHSFRGTRTCGTGNKKNGRGAGNRGGRGNSGLKKNKFTKVTSKMPDYFKKKGFVPKAKKKQIPVLNLYDVEKVLTGKYPENKYLSFNKQKSELIFKGKILGTGTLSSSVHIKAYAWSKKAEEKLNSIKGSIAKLEETKTNKNLDVNKQPKQ